MDRQYQDTLEGKIKEIREEAKRELEEYITQVQIDSSGLMNKRFKNQIDDDRGSNIKEVNHLNNDEKDEFKKQIEDQMRFTVERNFKEKFEIEKEQIVKKFLEEQALQQKSMNTMEIRVRERIRIELEEEMKKELLRKEKLMQLNWKKKMETHKKTIEETYEIEWKQKIEIERKEIEKERIEIGIVKYIPLYQSTLTSLIFRTIKKFGKYKTQKSRRIEAKFRSKIQRTGDKIHCNNSEFAITIRFFYNSTKKSESRCFGC